MGSTYLGRECIIMSLEHLIKIKNLLIVMKSKSKLNLIPETEIDLTASVLTAY